MKIASYNLWESDAGMPERFGQLRQEIAACDADLLCLQETADLTSCEALARDYPFFLFNEVSGTAILSRYPLTDPVNSEFASAATVMIDGYSVRTISLHLPWKHAAERERAIVALLQETNAVPADYTLLAGDFNSTERSAVHRFLTGEESLLGADAFFFDLAEAWAETTGIPPAPTLNFRKNPRWGVIDPPNTLQVSGRYDRILLKNPYPQDVPILHSFTLFGTAVSPVTRLCASDHYGVLAELTFPL